MYFMLIWLATVVYDPDHFSISASPGIPGLPPRRYNRGSGSVRGFQRGYPRSGSRGYPFVVGEEATSRASLIPQDLFEYAKRF
jgi:hypothetical protein